MRFTFAALLATLATTCFAHKVSTLAFPPTAPVSPGSKIVVQVVRGDTLTPSIERCVAIGSCTTTNSVCLPPGQALGTILFKGPFDPKFPRQSSTGPLQQNFTVTNPSTFAPGPAELSIFHPALIGNMAFSETVTITLDVTT